MINESNQNHTYLNLDEDPSLNLSVPQVNSLGIPTHKTRKQWYQTNSPRIRSYITGNLSSNVSGKGAKSLQRAADEYQHLSEEFARRGYSSKAMSRKYDNFNGIDSSLFDLALENENSKLNTYQDQFNSEKINERQFNRLQQKQQRRISNLNENYNTLAEISANKRGIPLVRTQSSVSPAPFVLGTVGAPLLLAGMISGGVAAAPAINAVLSNPLVQGYFAYNSANNLVSDRGVKKTIKHFKNGEIGRGLWSAVGDLSDIAMTGFGASNVYKAGKKLINTGIQQAREIQAAEAALFNNRPQITKVENIPGNPYLAKNGTPENSISYIEQAFKSGNQARNSAVTQPSKSVPIPKNVPASIPKAVNSDLIPPFLRNPNVPKKQQPQPPAVMINHSKKIFNTPKRPSDLKVNDELTKNFLEYVNSHYNPNEPFSDPSDIYPHRFALDEPFIKQFYISQGIDPMALTPEVMGKAAAIAQKSVKEAFQGVNGTIAYPHDFGTSLYYYRNGYNNKLREGNPTGVFNISLHKYLDEFYSPKMKAYRSDLINSLNPNERGVSKDMYDAAINFAKLQGDDIEGLVSGEHLLSPEQTYSIWEKFADKIHMGNFGLQHFGNGNFVDWSRLKPTLVQGKDGSWRLVSPRRDIFDGPVYLLTKPTNNLPVKVGSVLDPTRIVKHADGTFELTPLNLKNNNLYKVLAPITGGAAGTYFTFGNNNNQ